MKQLTVMMALLILVGCSASKKLNSWLGSSKQDIIMGFGPPELITPDGSGGQILTYTRYNSTAYYGTVYENTAYIHWYVNDSGIVYHWLVNRERSAIPAAVVLPNYYTRPPVAVPNL